ncbi:hypothetical protein pdam_00022040 [Pocillopora damicornis]|uniref:SERRATE/Ars2 N-terminal domain-containing protein n=1 Tax=Pocillopora damicornis TaxID=46731 RepID=A0A3M6ULZ9_POCDA|nr:hypothetical protein pdam_00022040 [Pocillopora damicornis]
MKYHPKEMALKQKEYKKSMQRRLSVFLNLLKSGRADDISLDIDNSEAIIKLLDAVVIKLEGGLDSDLVVLDCPPTPPPERRRSSSNPLMSPQTDDMATDDKKEETLKNMKEIKKDPETGPVSPSSVPLPSAPPPASAKAAATKKENGDVKVMSISNPTLEQQQLQHQAQQYYHQQQLYYQQQYYSNYDPQQQQEQYSKQYPQGQQQELPQTSQPDKDPPAQQKGSKKEDEPKKKRKRRHREPYYYDAMDDDESESESESDSEPEPAPPGEEMSPMDTGKEDELLPPGVDAGPEGVQENLQQPVVDDPSKASQVENIVQLPTSSSNAKLQTSTDDKPDSCEPSVGSSQPETSTSSNGAITEGGSSHAVVETSGETELSDGTPADSTQGLQGKERNQEYEVETSSTEQAESSSSVPEKDAYQVGSTDNGTSTMQKEDNSEIFPEPSSSEAQGKVVSMEAEPSSASSLPSELTKPASEQVLQKAEAMEGGETKEDSNKVSEKKEIVEETSPVKDIPKENKEKMIEEKEKDTTEEGEEKDEANGSDGKQVCVTAEPRALHKTFSLFMRSVPPNISKADISAICKRFAGFLRVALSDPSPERKFVRRGWITFDRSVNIKEICWDLNNIRVKDVELSPVVNRDLSRRVRPVAGAALAKQAIRHDIKLAARLIREFDKRAALYEKETKEETEAREKAEKEAAEKTEEGEECEAKPADECEIPDLPNENPILSSLSQDAAEEEEGEEMELMRTASTSQGDTEEKPEVDLSCDSSLMRVLDRLILYLRVVHSVDYYNGTDYPYEDEMPNRCGIIHVRGATPDKCTLSEVQEWQTGINQKLEPFLQEKESLKDEEVAQLGKKDPDY